LNKDKKKSGLQLCGVIFVVVELFLLLNYGGFFESSFLIGICSVLASENGNRIFKDNEGNIVYTDTEDLSYTILGNDLILLKESENNIAKLVDHNGNEVIHAGTYDDIVYSEKMDLFGFEKDNKVYVGRIVPVSVLLDGNKVEFDQNPVIKDDRTLVPVRAIFEALGATVGWEQETKTVTSTLGDKTINLTIGSNIMYVDGEAVELDVAAEIMNDRTLVPARAVSEAFGCTVEWDDASKTVVIQSK